MKLTIIGPICMRQSLLTTRVHIEGKKIKINTGHIIYTIYLLNTQVDTQKKSKVECGTICTKIFQTKNLFQLTEKKFLKATIGGMLIKRFQKVTTRVVTRNIETTIGLIFWQTNQ
jgi:hypothetical protein